MFKYNELSDLKDGRLVTPIRMDNGKVLCIMEDGTEEFFDFSDFDFDKKIEDRKFLINIENIICNVKTLLDLRFKKNKGKNFKWIISDNKIMFQEKLNI